MLPNKKEEYFSDEESARRRDGVVRVMANTLPQPRTKTSTRRPRKKKKAGPDRKSREADKGRV